MLGAGVLKHEQPSEVPGGFIKHRWLGSTSGASDSVALWPGLGICISNRFLGDMLLIWGPHFENHWVIVSIKCKMFTEDQSVGGSGGGGLVSSLSRR